LWSAVLAVISVIVTNKCRRNTWIHFLSLSHQRRGVGIMEVIPKVKRRKQMKPLNKQYRVLTWSFPIHQPSSIIDAEAKQGLLATYTLPGQYGDRRSWLELEKNPLVRNRLL
jgi:hypothetical protein